MLSVISSLRARALLCLEITDQTQYYFSAQYPPTLKLYLQVVSVTHLFCETLLGYHQVFYIRILKFPLPAEPQGKPPGLGRSPGEGSGWLLSSILTWRIPWSIIHGVAKSRTRLSNFHFILNFLMCN